MWFETLSILPLHALLQICLSHVSLGFNSRFGEMKVVTLTLLVLSPAMTLATVRLSLVVLWTSGQA